MIAPGIRGLWLGQQFSKIDYPLGLLEAEPAMCCQAVVVVDIHIGGELAAALLAAPTRSGIAQGPGHAPAPVLRPHENPFEEKRRAVFATVYEVGADCDLRESHQAGFRILGDKGAKRRRIPGKCLEKSTLICGCDLGDEFRPQCKPGGVVRVAGADDFHFAAALRKP